MGRGKQFIILFLILILGIGCVYLGIQIKNKPEPQEETVLYGNYQEHEISLPVLNTEKGEEYLHMTRNAAGSVELFTVLYNEDKTLVRGYKKYQLNDKLTWDEVDADWMALEFFSDTSYVIRLMSYADTGSLYLVLHDMAATTPVSDEVVRIGSDNSVEHVGVKALYQTHEDGTPIQLTHMMIANNAICITNEQNECYAYSLVTGELLTGGRTPAPYALASDGSKLFLMNLDCSSVLCGSLTTSDVSTSDIIGGSVALPSYQPLWEQPVVYEAGETEFELLDYRLYYFNDALYLACQDGIYSAASKDANWQLLLTGTDCIFGRPSVVQQNFFESNGALYSFSRDQTDKYYFTQYTRPVLEDDDDRKDNDNRTTLTIASYRRRAVITEAVVTFQRKNPDIHVIYDVALDKNPTLTIAEYRAQIDAAMQNGTAPDILVCDELDYRSYMNAGYFESISDLMKPMYTSANLYGNVANALAQTKIYVTPAKFRAYIAYGSREVITHLNDLPELAEWCTKKEFRVFSEFSTTQLLDLLCSFYEENFMTDTTPDPALLANTLTAFRSTAKVTSGSNTAEPEWYALPVVTDNALDPAITRIDSAEAFADMLTQLSGTDLYWTSACGRVEPESIVGISSHSGNVKLAKEFLRTLYSDSVQLQDVGAGLPMGQDAIAAWSKYGISEAALTQLTAELQTLNHCFTDNTRLKAAVQQVLELFLLGDLTAEDAAAAIVAYQPVTPVDTPFRPAGSAFNALFVGDAFTDTSGLVTTFTALAKLTYPDATVNACVHSQESLKEQLKYMEQDNYLTYDRIRNADVVVLQEKANSLTSTVQAVSRTLSYCKEDARVYYLVTDRENSTDIIKRLSIFENLTIIPVGAFTDYLSGDTMTGITAEHLRSDGAANALYGYVSALTAYRTIFGTLPANPDAEALTAEATGNLLAYVPGDGETIQRSHLNLLPTVLERYLSDLASSEDIQ